MRGERQVAEIPEPDGVPYPENQTNRLIRLTDSKQAEEAK